MQSLNLRFDFFFSYWIFIWAILYYFITRTQFVNSKTKEYIQINVNPKFALYIALFENICTLIYLLFHTLTTTLIIKYLFMIFALKIIPLYLLQEEKIHLPKDLLSVSSLFVVYNVYLTFFQTSLYAIYNSSLQSFIMGNNQTPFFHLLQNITDYIILVRKGLGSRFSGEFS